MPGRQTIEPILAADNRPDLGEILETILPEKGEAYSLSEIANRLDQVRDEVEELHRKNNDFFDSIIDDDSRIRLENLYQNLHNTQLSIMKLQCDIAFTKEQYETVHSTCNNPLIHQRRELLVEEASLRNSLQELKFRPIKEFFDRFTNHLSATVVACQRLCSQQASSYVQMFDWVQYQQSIYMIRACGKALLDMEKFERLYQLNLVNITNMVFKQPLDRLDFNNFVEFQDTYSLETQLEIFTSQNQRQNVTNLLSEPSIQQALNSKEPLEYVVFKPINSRLESTTVECCRLLLDLNMNYIEAHLTDGINIDKLNGGENSALSLPEEQTLPIYAFSPQEYINQIGQHLLTLRKQTEQFDNTDSESLKFALEFLQQAQDISLDIKTHKTVTEIIMQCIARLCIRSFLGRTSNSILSKLTTNGKRQLATDALYLDNVLEDLRLLNPSEPNVAKFKSLLVQ